MGALVSIVVNNHDYGRFLPACLDSALAQDWPHVEVVVVDDGSTDDSAEVLQRYADRVTVLLKEQGGQTSAVNAGFAVSRGDVVLFLDSDDVLAPCAARVHAEAMADGDVARSQGVMVFVDADGRPVGDRLVDATTGDVAELVRDRGPGTLIGMPMSGNAWSRSFLDAVMPLPDNGTQGATDSFLMDAAALFGRVTMSDEVVCQYRRHGASLSDSRDLRNGPECARERYALHRARQRFLAQVAFPDEPVEEVMDRWTARNWRTLVLAQLSQPDPEVPRPSTAALLHAAWWRRPFDRRVAVVLLVLLLRVLPGRRRAALAERFMPGRFL